MEFLPLALAPPVRARSVSEGSRQDPSLTLRARTDLGENILLARADPLHSKVSEHPLLAKRPAMHNVLTFILGGGRGTRLYPLTKHRSEPAVPIAGKYRLIDIPLSNCLNSGLNRIYVLTQFNSVSLHRHIRRAYQFDQFGGGFVVLLAAQQTMDRSDWYQG